MVRQVHRVSRWTGTDGGQVRPVTEDDIGLRLLYTPHSPPDADAVPVVEYESRHPLWLWITEADSLALVSWPSTASAPIRMMAGARRSIWAARESTTSTG